MSGGGRKPSGSVGEEAEVDALLRAAQDAVMLKLKVNSHLVLSPSASNPPSLDPAPDSLDADLARRFDALRSRPPAPKRPDTASATAAAAGGMDELEARFAALNGAAGPEKETRVRPEDLGGESEDDEVEKVMRWAMDAARLDVATAGTDKAKRAEEAEEKDERSSVSSEEDEEEEERLELEMERKRKEMSKNKSKSKSKWFFF